MNKKILVGIFILTVSAFFLAFFLTSINKLRLTPDSKAYISISINLRDGAGYKVDNGNFAPDWPPLFPFSLFVLGGDAVASARVLNVLLFTILIFLTGLFFSQQEILPLPIFGGIFLVLFSIPLWFVLTSVWSEPLFIVMSIATLVSLNKYLRTNRNRWLFVTILFASLAFLTRYIGLTLIAAVSISLVFLSDGSFWKRVKRAAISGLAASLFTLLWLARNFLVTGTIAGTRIPSEQSLSNNIWNSISTIVNWFLPNRFSNSTAIILAVFIISLALVIYSLRKMTALPITLFPTLVYITMYISFLIISSSITFYDLIGNRLLAPIYIPMIAIGTASMTPLFKKFPQITNLVWLIFVTYATARCVVTILDR